MRKIIRCAVAMVIGLSLSHYAQSHMMDAQHGTLNFLENGVYLVISLPMSAFPRVDANEDGQVSIVEFNRRRGAIIEAIRRNVVLHDDKGAASLEGIILSPEISHDSAGRDITQLVVLGRFALVQPEGELRFVVGLFGEGLAERSMEITAKRASGDKHTFVLTEDAPQTLVFAQSEAGMAQPVAIR